MASSYLLRLLLALLPCLVGVAAALSPTRAVADEGLWTFDNFPSAAVKARYGVDIDQAWLDRVRGAAVRLSTGCSASIVTADGLVLSNHHCVRNCAQQLSTPQQDFVKDGFLAAGRAGEKTCAGMVAEVLSGIVDVSARVTAATARRTGEDFIKARDAEIAAVEKQGCAGQEQRYRCQVVTLYQGGRYQLYTYRKYSDVRLVFAPEGETAFFGGDPDNFNFPRYDLDCSFVRLYEDGKPVATPGHLRWSTEAPRDGAPVFVAGNPGTTQRLLTADQLATLRDVALPETLILYSELRGRLLRFTSESAEHARIANDLLFRTENSFKNFRGQEQSLVEPGLIIAKRAADRELRARAARDPKLAGLGNPWADIARAQEPLKAIYRRYTLTESRAGLGSNLFGYARALVRAAQERVKPNGERLPEYTDSRLALLAKQVLDPEPVYPDLEQLTLGFWLSKLREGLTVDSPDVRTFLVKDSPETLAARLAGSRLGDAAIRKALWDGGLAAVTASDDPMIRFVLATDATSRAVRRQYENEVSGPVSQAAQKIARARFAIYGTRVYPDATFTLRLSYGKVTGWSDHDTAVPPFTRYAGLWERTTGQFPFALTPRWQDARGRVDQGTVLDFASDNDIVGGNSGSPVIDAQGQVVGAIFDGNIHSLGGVFGFDGRVNRAVSVSTAAITEALGKVYGAQALVAELTARD
ncbi:MAG TPA: S46 family peptidase [Steroidobacteraceae bacterium]|nr:S46 family peptidase [Steroidobacteraceae bacterium]